MAEQEQVQEQDQNPLTEEELKRVFKEFDDAGISPQMQVSSLARIFPEFEGVELPGLNAIRSELGFPVIQPARGLQSVVDRSIAKSREPASSRLNLPSPKEMFDRSIAAAKTPEGAMLAAAIMSGAGVGAIAARSSIPLIARAAPLISSIAASGGEQIAESFLLPEGEQPRETILQDTLDKTQGMVDFSPDSLGGRSVRLAQDVLLDSVFSKGIRAVGNLRRGASRQSDSLDSTLGQSGDSSFISIAEEAFTPARVQRAQRRSGILAGDVISSDVNQRFGRRRVTSGPATPVEFTPEGLTQLVLDLESKTRSNYLRAIKASTDFGNEVVFRAKNHQGSVTLKSGKVVPIDGPIDTKELLDSALTIYNKIPTSQKMEGVKTSLVSEIEDLFSKAGVKFDKKPGKLVITGFDHIEFVDAWELKKHFGKLGHGDIIKGTVFEDPQFRTLAKKMDASIEKSIKELWDDTDALDAYQASKKITDARYRAFAPGGKAANGAGAVLQEAREPIPEVDAILGDVKRMKRFLASDEILQDESLPTHLLKGKGRIEGFGGRATKQDLQAYAFMKTMFESTWTDPKGFTRFDPIKLQDAWKKLSTSASGKELFGSKVRGDLDKTFDIIAQRVNQVAEVGGVTDISGNRYIALKLASGMVQIGAPIAVGMTAFGPNAVGFGAIGLIWATMTGLGILATNPTTSRLLHNMLRGGPLGMSSERASRLVGHALIGLPMTFQTQDGTQIQGTLDNDGQPTADLNQEELNSSFPGITVDPSSLPNPPQSEPAPDIIPRGRKDAAQPQREMWRE